MGGGGFLALVSGDDGQCRIIAFRFLGRASHVGTIGCEWLVVGGANLVTSII